METLEREQVRELAEPKFCHILCVCHPHIAMCGAYKPIKCKRRVVNSEGIIETVCPVCNRLLCPDCEELLYSKCLRCGR